MSWVFGFGRDRVTKCQYPIAILVSNKCSEALRTLEPDGFEEFCVNSKADAKAMVLKKHDEYTLCLKEWGST